jgi:peptidyl-prolyl cis-trans isomerase B (cyclophilin B)
VSIVIAGGLDQCLPLGLPETTLPQKLLLLAPALALLFLLLPLTAQTVNSFVFLAQQDYFNHTHCHRLTTSGLYVLQCGDPTGTGTGGPGYTFPDEYLNDPAIAGGTYPAGTVAMANSGPNPNGSQFFLVYQASQLSAAYTPFGTITSGLDILQHIAADGVSGGGTDGAPKDMVYINSVPVTKD